ncbi:MAG: S-layer homology domain-containing protein [Oscillospiraceae bacterium]|nr:S-layer homology domain-containing protein [Oscillospiraceae bacterium]MBR2890028.1 S-layer homology domain-containing protein [Oscillospiraceae bacterium]
MIKRMLCLSLSVLLLLGLLPLTATAAESGIGLQKLAEGESYREMCVSQNMLDIIKDVEGFSPTPYWDVTQWTIGYGTACGYNWSSKPDMTVTREEAEKMLLMDVNAKYGKIVNDYCSSIGRQPNQQQFDALLDFTYNLGGNWTRGCMLTDWLENPTTELDLVNAMGRWGRVNSKPSYSTCMRRIREAIIFLKGEYYLTYGNGSFETELQVVANHDLPYYHVVIFDCNGGESDGLSGQMQFYLADQPIRSYPIPEREGYTFLGWQVTKERNSSISEAYPLRKATLCQENLYAVAQWAEGEVEVEPDPDVPGETFDSVPVSLTGTVNTKLLTIRTGPGVGYQSLALLSQGDRVEITATATGDGYTWGKIQEGWICLDYVLLDEPEETQPTEPESTEPEETEPDETEPEVTEPEVTEPEETEPEPTEPEESDLFARTGTVNTAVLTVRSGPGTEYESVGHLIRDERVIIYERRDDGTRFWGRMDEGWICLDYVLLDPPKTVVGYVSTDLLTVRTGPGVDYASVGLLSRDERVEITERRSDGTRDWGRIESGWICLDYVSLLAPEDTWPDGSESTLPGETEPTEPTEPEETEPTEPEPTEPEFPFEDVPEDSWYRECVAHVFEKGYMQGMSATRFGPEESMTRAMLVTVLYRLAGEPEVSEEFFGMFDDVKETDYFSRSVAWAKENGIVHGVSEASFAPNRKVTRQDAVTIFHRYFEKYLNHDGSSDLDLSGYADSQFIAQYALPAIQWAVENGLLTGSEAGDLLNPAAELTRAQAARIMFALDCLLEEMV